MSCDLPRNTALWDVIYNQPIQCSEQQGKLLLGKSFTWQNVTQAHMENRDNVFYLDQDFSMEYLVFFSLLLTGDEKPACCIPRANS